METDDPAHAEDTLAGSRREAQAVIDKANRMQPQAEASKTEQAQAYTSARQEPDRANAEP